jgi:opacity protein-like surface antigen
MRSLLALLAAVAIGLGAPAAAHAAEPAPAPATAAGDDCSDDADAPACRQQKLELGARVGYALAFGSLMDGTKLNTLADGHVPLCIDAGLRLDPHWYVGAYGSLGYVVPADGLCPPGASCSGTDARFGLQARYSFLPDHRLDPWVGIGAGYEWLHVSESLGERSVGATFSGFELFNVQAGADYRVSKGVSVGPFAALSFGQYKSESVTVTSGSLTADRSASIDNQALHEWLTLGVRGRFDL